MNNREEYSIFSREMLEFDHFVFVSFSRICRILRKNDQNNTFIYENNDQYNIKTHLIKRDFIGI